MLLKDYDSKIIVISMISFAKQLSELFSYAGYKTQGIWITTKLQCLPSSNYERLTYKVTFRV